MDTHPGARCFWWDRWFFHSGMTWNLPIKIGGIYTTVNVWAIYNLILQDECFCVYLYLSYPIEIDQFI